MQKFRIKSRDQVLVVAGKYKGATGEVQKIDREKGRVFISGVNVITRNKKGQQPQQKVASIAVSNVSLFVEKDGKKIPSKVKRIVENGVSKRVLVKTGKEVIESAYVKKSSNLLSEEAVKKIVEKAAAEEKAKKKTEVKAEEVPETKAAAVTPKATKKTESKAKDVATKAAKKSTDTNAKKSTTAKKTTKKAGEAK
ncbi:MAG: 50S ribosomal protein L24 [Alphaproteobacteria bacterium]|nr:MAG: 50S ribosomal protein L24 [Alphaproteobacteria bacterium]